MTLTVSELAALLTEAVSRIGTWQERAEWLLPRLRGESDDLAAKVPASGPAATTHHGQGVIPYRGPSVGESVLPREPSEAAIREADAIIHRWLGANEDHVTRNVTIFALRAAYAIDGVPAVDAGEKP